MKRGLEKTAAGLLLFFAVALVYYESPLHGMTDSAFSLLMDEAILHQGTPNMISFQVPHGTVLGYVNGYPWNIALVKGRLVYVFPWGLPILSLPGVGLANVLGYEVAPNRVYSHENEIRMQGAFTTILSALIVVLVFDAASLLLPLYGRYRSHSAPHSGRRCGQV